MSYLTINDVRRERIDRDLGGGGPMKLLTAMAVPKGRLTFAAMVMLKVLICRGGRDGRGREAHIHTQTF